MFNVLISSAGRRVSLVNLFKKALADLGVPGEVVAVDVSPLAAAWQCADRRRLVPPCTSPSYIDALLDVCRTYDIGLIIPTIDTELPVLSENRFRFMEIGTTVAISGPETVAISADKALTNRWLRKNGFPCVRQGLLDEVAQDCSGYNLPLVAKPRSGSASIGVQMVDHLWQLDRYAGRDYLVEEMAPGHEHTVDVFVDSHGTVRCAVPRRRVEVRAGEISKGVTVRDGQMQELAAAICARLPGAFGVLNIQMFFDSPSGRLNVIELNPRFGGGFPLSARAGADYPKWLLQDVLGLPSSAEMDGWREGVMMLRFDAEVFLEPDCLTGVVG